MNLIKGECCQKCGSKNVYLDYDLGRWYEHCLICGYTVPLEEIKPAKEDEASWPDDVSIET
jgi:hypothetical protein